MSYLYIASPYTHADPAVRQLRYEKVRDFTAWLAFSQGLYGYSPIVHSHDICLNNSMPVSFDFWGNWCRAMIRPSRGIIVFQISGWDISIGIMEELNFARERHLPVYNSEQHWPQYDHTV